jgi:hypothetical protein
MSLIHRHQRGLDLAVALGILLAVAAPNGHAQNALRRDAPIQPLALARTGDLLFGFGAGYESGVTVPLIAAWGDMTRIGIVKVAWAVADGVILEFGGDAYRALTVDSLGADPPVEPDEGVFDGKSTGAGDFYAGISFLVFRGGAEGVGGGPGFGVGGRLEFNIPDSNQAEGLGTNTTNIRMSVLGSYGNGPWLVTGDVGIAILEAPLVNFEQNDVIVYSAEVLYGPHAALPLRVYAGVIGRASARSTVPIGTEDTGDVLAGADLRLGRWLIDASGAIGYAGLSPDWRVTGGIALLVGRDAFAGN